MQLNITKAFDTFFFFKEHKFFYISQKTPSLRPRITFIYESIMIKIYMNTNIMNTQIFFFNKYDLKGN